MPVYYHRVTALEEDRRIDGNILVEIDNRRFASLPADTVASLELKVGLDLEDEHFERLEHAADVEAAYLVAVRILTAMPRAVKDLKMRVRQRGHKSDIVDEAVGRLERAGLLDDAEFSRHFTRVRLGRGHGPPRILTDLLSKGVDRGLAERSIAEVVEAEQFEPDDRVRLLAEKRSGQFGDLAKDVKRRRLVAYLRRRGFRGYEVTEIIEEVLATVES